MNLTREEVGDVTVLRLEGLMDGGKGCQALRSLVESLAAQGPKKVVVDLARVSWLNSQGLGVLHACHRAIQGSGGSLKLTHLNPRVRQVLAVSRFDTLFESYDDVRGALASFYRMT